MTIRRRWAAGAALFGLMTIGLLVQPPRAACGADPSGPGRGADGVFQVQPYIQLGDAPGPSAEESLVVMWQAADVDSDWSVEARPSADRPWAQAGAPASRRVAVDGLEPFRLYRATVAGLEPGAMVTYRVLRGGSPVFEAQARARKPAGRPHRFVAFGDCGAGTPGEKAVAYQAYLARPDFVMIPGDIVYSRGRISEYLDRFFPVYNSDVAAPGSGAPLLRSTLFLAAPGNHDLAERNFDRSSDLLAYFLYWNQPLNGPDGPAASPVLLGSESRRRSFLDAAGSAFPRMANFSFDYGDAHWTICDSNPYPHWTVDPLRQWLERDLASEPARRATWRFVAFHHPGFNSSRAHFSEQRMRLMADVFEKNKVDLVFCGHVHNYQRTYPLRFVAERAADGSLTHHQGRVGGGFTLDKDFDGSARTRPDGVIYLITGAGGAGLYNPEQHVDPASWQEFTARFISNTHSLTVVDVDAHKLTVRQVSSQGDELDRFLVTK